MPVLISHLGAGSPAGAQFTSGAIDTTGANFLVMVLSSFGQAGNTPSDSYGNTWIQGPTSGNGTCGIWYVENATVGIAHTFTSPSGTAFDALVVQAWSGVVASSSIDGSASAAGLSPGSMTPSQNGDLLITGYGGAGNAPFSVDSSYTLGDTIDNAAGNNLACALAYQIQSVAGPISPTWTPTGSGFDGTVQAAFMASGGSPPPATSHLFGLLGVGG